MRSPFSSFAALALPMLLAGAPPPAPTPEPHTGPEGTIAGLIHLPPGASAGEVCPRLRVSAEDAAGRPYGTLSMHTGGDHCNYSLGYLRAGVPLTVQVRTGEVKPCPRGAAATRSRQPIVLQRNETRTVDIQLRCG